MTALLSKQQSYNPLYVEYSKGDFSAANSRLMELKQTISANLSDPSLVAADLAAHLYMSERQFFRLVKNLTDKTPNLFLREMRLAKAKTLIQSGRFFRLKEIAIQVGYKRVDYFSNLYEQRFGVRPIDLI